MRLIRIAVASVNTTVGAVRGNVDRAIVPRAKPPKTARPSWRCRSSSSRVTHRRTSSSGGAFVDAQWKELERFAEATRATSVVPSR